VLTGYEPGAQTVRELHRSLASHKDICPTNSRPNMGEGWLPEKLKWPPGIWPRMAARQMRCLLASRKLNRRIARVPQAEVRVAYAQRTSPRRLRIGEWRLWRRAATFLHRKCTYFLVLSAQVNPAVIWKEGSLGTTELGSGTSTPAAGERDRLRLKP
jgi:hypothetical protein